MRGFGRRVMLVTGVVLLVAAGSVLAQGGGAGPVQQFTTEPGIDVDAVYSPNGQYVLYASSRSGMLELWMRPVGGGALYQITTSSNNSADRNPSFTPDGQVVVFQSDRVTAVRNIWAITISNRALLQLTGVPDGAANPEVSPQGDQVCYTRSAASGALSIWIMGIDGRNAREVGPGIDCTWTPDGRRVVFARDISTRGDPQYDLWVMDADGRNARALFTTANGWERAPAVSPDGRWVLYTRYPQPFTADIQEVMGGFQIYPGLRAGIWVAPLDASAPPREVVNDQHFNSYAAWSPDGTKIVFTSTRSGSADLWELPVPGLGAPAVARGAAQPPAAAPAQRAQPAPAAATPATPPAGGAATPPPGEAAQARPAAVAEAQRPPAAAQQTPPAAQPAAQAAPPVVVPAPAVNLPAVPPAAATPELAAAPPAPIGLAVPRYAGRNESDLMEYSRLVVPMLDSAIVTLRGVFEGTSGLPMAGANSPDLLSQRERARWTRCREVYADLASYQPAATALAEHSPAAVGVRAAALALAEAMSEVLGNEGCDLISSMIEAPERWQPWRERYERQATEFYASWYAPLRAAHTRGRELARALNDWLPEARRVQMPPALPPNPPYAGQ